MPDDQNSQAQLQRGTGRVIGGAVVAGIVSGLFAGAVSILAGSALAAAVRRRLEQMDAPPSAVARQSWARAKAATSAGLDAWRDEQPVTQPQ